MVIDNQNLPFHILFYDILLLYVLLRLVTFLVSVLEVLHRGILLCISSKLHMQRCSADSLKVATVGIFIPRILENIINEGFLSSQPSILELVVKYLPTYHLVWLQSWAVVLQ